MQQSLSKRKAHSSTELKEKALGESSGLKMEAKANENEYGILATQIRLRVPYLSLIPMLDPLGTLLNWYSSQFRVPVSISTPEPAFWSIQRKKGRTLGGAISPTTSPWASWASDTRLLVLFILAVFHFHVFHITRNCFYPAGNLRITLLFNII